MTREETIRLLKICRAAYPYKSIQDPSGMIDAWQLAFGGEQAERIYKAARLHMNTNKFFPTIADIREAMKRSDLIYGESLINNALPSGDVDDIFSDTSGCTVCPYEEDCDRKECIV